MTDHVNGVTVNGVGGDIRSSDAVDPEFRPTILDPRFTRTTTNAPTHRNVVKGRPESKNTKRMRKWVEPNRPRTGSGQFAQKLNKKVRLSQSEINRRGMYGY